MEYIRLNNGIEVPAIGFGTYKMNKEDFTIQDAYDAGYRYFDTASFYNNEAIIGNSIKEAGIKREDVMLASKAWKTQMGYHEIKKGLEETLENLQTDYLDMYLIHWPLPEPGFKGWKELDLECWGAMEEMVEAGKIRAIGLSNFLPHHVQNILDHCKIRPAVDQLQFHPGYTQEYAVNYCKENGILVQGWKPLGRGAVLNNPVLNEIAGHYGVTTAKLCLRYQYQRGLMPLPKSNSKERMKENLDIFGFEISMEDIHRISSMASIGWTGEHPDHAFFSTEGF
ncbi:MAG: aldo/keto reductase [Dorea sp.]|nr:aldo/keto reductase [Dorea sp.]